jgi:hypothetical protein
MVGQRGGFTDWQSPRAKSARDEYDDRGREEERQQQCHREESEDGDEAERNRN